MIYPALDNASNLNALHFKQNAPSLQALSPSWSPIFQQQHGKVIHVQMIPEIITTSFSRPISNQHDTLVQRTRQQQSPSSTLSVFSASSTPSPSTPEPFIHIGKVLDGGVKKRRKRAVGVKMQSIGSTGSMMYKFHKDNMHNSIRFVSEHVMPKSLQQSTASEHDQGGMLVEVNSNFPTSSTKSKKQSSKSKKQISQSAKLQQEIEFELETQTITANCQNQAKILHVNQESGNFDKSQMTVQHLRRSTIKIADLLN